MLGFLRRNLRQASEETKAQAYFTMVRSNLDYCSTIWSPYQRDQKHQVEMVQRRSARFVTNRYRNTSSVTVMLDYLGWESHETRRSKLQLIVLYKIVHGLIDIPPTDYLTQTNSRTRLAHKYKYKQYSTSTDCFKWSFFRRTAVWPNLLMGIYLPAMNVHPNEEWWAVSSGLVPRFPQGRQIGLTLMGEKWLGTTFLCIHTLSYLMFLSLTIFFSFIFSLAHH